MRTPQSIKIFFNKPKVRKITQKIGEILEIIFVAVVYLFFFYLIFIKSSSSYDYTPVPAHLYYNKEDKIFFNERPDFIRYRPIERPYRPIVR